MPWRAGKSADPDLPLLPSYLQHARSPSLGLNGLARNGAAGSPGLVVNDNEGALPDGIAESVDEQLPDFDVGDLDPGDLYPGMYAGVEYHVEASGRPFRNTRRGRQFMMNAEVRGAAELVFRLKCGGKFVLSPDNHMATRVIGWGSGQLELRYQMTILDTLLINERTHLGAGSMSYEQLSAWVY